MRKRRKQKRSYKNYKNCNKKFKKNTIIKKHQIINILNKLIKM